MRPVSRRFPALSLALLASAFAASIVSAQTVANKSSTVSRGWRASASLHVTEEYDDNVFLVSDGMKGSLGADASNGNRYTGMASSSDLITGVGGAFELRGPGLGGRALSLQPELRYDHYARNSDRSRMDMKVTLAQKLGRGGMFRLRGTIVPNTFYKNYLADAVDADASGSIDPGERVYAANSQAERAFTADYTMRLNKSTKVSPFGASVRVGGGWYARSNTASFQSRDLSGPTAGAKLVLDVSKKTRFAMGYDLAMLGAAPQMEVMIVNEAIFKRDLNGNRTLDDPAARTVQSVDRSRTEHEVGLSMDTDLGRSEIELGYARRMRSFGSSEPFDLANNGRQDARNEVGGELRLRLAQNLRLRFAGQYSVQSLNRANANQITGDVADYSRLRGSVGFTYRH